MTPDGIYEEQDFRNEARFHEIKPQNGPDYIVVRMLKQAADLKKENEELKRKLTEHAELLQRTEAERVELKAKLLQKGY